MIFIRDDDVLLPHSSWPDPLARFKVVHELIKKYDFVKHVPAIVTDEIGAYPGAVDYIRRETEEGHMLPQFHGTRHIDYANLTPEEILRDYQRGQDWFMQNLGFHFTKHYTPWGAGADERGAHIGPTAAHAGILMVTCADLLIPLDISDDPAATREKYDGREIFIHWWAGVRRIRLALNRIK